MDALQRGRVDSLRDRLGARMDALALLACRLHAHQRQFEAERRTLVETRARYVDRAAVHFGQLLSDRQAQAQATALPRGAAFCLTKALEDVGQELRGDADARVTDRELHVRVDTFQANLNFASTFG